MGEVVAISLGELPGKALPDAQIIECPAVLG